jgi:hypothetical protein
VDIAMRAASEIREKPNVIELRTVIECKLEELASWKFQRLNARVPILDAMS